MRQWMLPVIIMCKQHLLGEHVEIHMFRGHLNRKRNVHDYIKNNCLEPLSLHERHDAIADEIDRRHKLKEFKKSKGHQSPLFGISLDHLSQTHLHHKIDKLQSLNDLLKRCPKCKERYELLCKSQPQKVAISL